MARKPIHPPIPDEAAKRIPLPARLSGDPDTDPQAARTIHIEALTGAVYANALRHKIADLYPKRISPSAMLHVEDVLARMAPRDPAEEMLIAQLVLTHARVLH